MAQRGLYQLSVKSQLWRDVAEGAIARANVAEGAIANDKSQFNAMAMDRTALH